jgi:hypothetical protein
MSKNITQSSQAQKTTTVVIEVHSAQELCEQLNKLVQQSPWKIEIAERFIHLIVRPEKQFQMDSKQQDSVFQALINCPIKYRAIVHLVIVAANFNAENGLRTLDGIIPRISSFISELLDLKDGIKENILKNQGDKQVSQFIKDKLNTKDTQQKSPKGKEDDKKFDFLRNLISLLICEGNTSAISSRLNIILEVLADSNHYQKLTKVQLKPEIDIKNRVKSVTEIFKLAKPNGTEAKRLLLYGSYAQILVSRQEPEIADLRHRLQTERELHKQREDYIFQLEQQCQELKRQLLDTDKELEKRQTDIEQERELYAQLETSSQAKISQQREATLSNVRNRLEHELNKLERCFGGSADNFQDASQMGLRILKKIREQLAE